MSEQKYPRGANVKSVKTQYGEIFKIGINLEKFCTNPDNNGWVNLELKRSKDGNPYLTLDMYKGG